MHLTELSSGSLEEICTALKERFYRPIAAIFLEMTQATAGHPEIHVLDQFVSYRENVLTPYLTALSSKVNDGHNCGSCTGKCAIGHAAILPDLKMEHDLLTSILASDVSPFDDADLRRLLVSAIHIESTCLLPAIINAQKQINAAG